MSTRLAASPTRERCTALSSMNTESTVEDRRQEYARTVSFLCGLERFGILLGLDNIAALLEKMGNPQRSFRSVHITGSNGKGSTASFIHGMVRAAGMRPALYTSPHLNDFRERIRLDGRLISEDAIIKATNKIRELYDPSRTTFFEFTTALAFDQISEFKPDLAVIEVGLGGRLDATNILAPEVSVITDVSLEHQDYLGSTIAAIAREKAGILKPGTSVVTGASRRQAREVILAEAQRLACPVREFGKDFRAVRGANGFFSYESAYSRLEDIRLSMAASYQVKNAALAIAVVEELIKGDYVIPEEAIREGIFATRFPGRFELLAERPHVIIDGAHTPEGMRLLKSNIRRLFPNKDVRLLLGMLKDKNYRDLASIIAPIAKEVACVAPQSNRALEPEELSHLLQARGIPASPHETIEEGFDYLRSKADPNDLILAAGSLYMIGPVRALCGYPNE